MFSPGLQIGIMGLIKVLICVKRVEAGTHPHDTNKHTYDTGTHPPTRHWYIHEVDKHTNDADKHAYDAGTYPPIRRWYTPALSNSQDM